MKANRGFTLLEVMVATTIMAIAVVGLLSAISASMRNAARLSDYDRSAMLARRKMDELLLDQRLPRFIAVEGFWDRAAAGVEGGWHARVTPVDSLPRPNPGSAVLDRVELEVWWKSGERRRTFTLEGFRRGILRPEDIALAGALPR